jgi:hypothetical protein
MVAIVGLIELIDRREFLIYYIFIIKADGLLPVKVFNLGNFRL